MNELERLESELEAPIRGLLDAGLPMPDNGRLLKIERDINPERGIKKLNLLWVALLLGLSGLVAAYMIASQTRNTPFEQVPVNQESPIKKDVKNKDDKGSEEYDNRNEGRPSTIYQQEVYGND